MIFVTKYLIKIFDDFLLPYFTVLEGNNREKKQKRFFQVFCISADSLHGRFHLLVNKKYLRLSVPSFSRLLLEIYVIDEDHDRPLPLLLLYRYEEIADRKKNFKEIQRPFEVYSSARRGISSTTFL